MPVLRKFPYYMPVFLTSCGPGSQDRGPLIEARREAVNHVFSVLTRPPHRKPQEAMHSPDMCGLHLQHLVPQRPAAGGLLVVRLVCGFVWVRLGLHAA